MTLKLGMGDVLRTDGRHEPEAGNEKAILFQFPQSKSGSTELARASEEIRSLRSALAEAQRRIEQLRTLAERDTLTPLVNRRRLISDLESMLAAPSPHGALLYIDLDDLKSINDTHGHTAGDTALLSLAHALQALAGPEDCAARLGGDEFALLIQGAGIEEASDRARRLCDALDTLLLRRWDGETFGISASIGAVALEAGQDAYDVLSLADSAMYACKRRQAARSDR